MGMGALAAVSEDDVDVARAAAEHATPAAWLEPVAGAAGAGAAGHRKRTKSRNKMDRSASVPHSLGRKKVCLLYTSDAADE